MVYEGYPLQQNEKKSPPPKLDSRDELLVPNVPDINEATSNLSLNQMIAITALILAFLIVLVMFIYYWWEVRIQKGNQMVASQILETSPALAEAILKKEVVGSIFSSFPDSKEFKPTDIVASPPAIPGVGGGLLSKLGSLGSQSLNIS